MCEMNCGTCDHGFMAERAWYQKGLSEFLPHCTFPSSHSKLVLHPFPSVCAFSSWISSLNWTMD